MQISRDVARRFKGAINSLWTGAGSSPADTRSAQGWSLVRSALAVLCVAVLMFGAQANAQTAGAGSIQGSILDPSGAAVPNAVVTLTEQSTQVTLTTKSSSAGTYAFPNINVGSYTLTVVAQGFDTYSSLGNILEVGSSISLDAKLTVGSTDKKIEVHADGLALQTEDATFKQTIDKTEINEMPLNGRQVEQLVTLAGGSTANSNPGDTNGSKFPTQSAGISIAGAQGNAVSWRLDGGDNNEWMGGNSAPLPFPDALGQFSVETAALGAQAGVHVGGLVNVVTQSGTNTYHGSMFEYGRRTRFDASPFFSTNHASLHEDQYGGTFGGHIIKDKLFAFAAFQHQYFNAAAATSSAYIPTAANIAGDFSATDSAGNCGQPILQLSDPISGVILPGNKYNQPGGPVLPAWNAASLALLKQLPAIDPALDPNHCGFVSYSIPSQNFDNQFDTRVDYTVNTKNTLYARYWLDSQQIPTFYSPTNILVTTQSGNPEIRYQSIVLGENYVISSNIVNTAHLTATRRQLTRGFNAATPNASVFGVKDFQAVPAGIWLSAGSANSNAHGAKSNNHGFDVGGGSNLLAVIDDNVPVAFNDDVTWLHGKHQITFGGSILRNQLNVNNGFSSDGNFNFSGIYSGAHAGTGGAAKVADPNLDFLEGAMSSFTQSLPQQNALRGYVSTLYVQDTFHATPRLTVTAGLNWEPQFFPVDVKHRGAVFNKAAFLANQHSSIYPQAPAGLFYYGDPGVSNNFTSNSPWQFNPNFAVTYDLSGTGKTVVRAGVAYAYDEPNFFAQQRVQQDPPFSANVGPNSSAQLCFSDPWLIGGNTNGNTTQGCAQQGGTDVDPFPFNPANFTFPQQAQIIVSPAQYKSPNTVQWTASLQQQFSHGWNAQIFYTGNRTQHMLASYPLNPGVYVPGLWTGVAGSTNYGCPGVDTNNDAAAQAAKTVGGGPVGTPCSVSNANQSYTTAGGVKVSLTPNQAARGALTQANPVQGNYYGGNSLQGINNAAGNYNGVIFTVQHRFSSSFSLLTNYTWSKCLNNQDPQGEYSGLQYSNPNNPAADYGRCGQNQDVRNIFNASIVLKSQFPIHGVAGYLINNWQVAPLVRLLSGTAINVTQNQDESFTGNGGDRPNIVPGVNPYRKVAIRRGATSDATSSYLNPAAFTLNTVYGTQGTVSRNSLNGPMFVQDDAEVSRIFPLYERVSLDLRLEAFNVLNHPSFNNPSSSGPTYGGSFGYITGQNTNGQNSYSRQFQFAAKLSF
ncbi:MAG TPA: carboxypeptidase-like regulatory domain-containing protein [Acidobacteriaceae bacterium]|nr:carboxypeptidase-like regulatory domain-containing protein [Acidobacteriaceae bacterium]